MHRNDGASSSRGRRRSELSGRLLRLTSALGLALAVSASGLGLAACSGGASGGDLAGMSKTSASGGTESSPQGGGASAGGTSVPGGSTTAPGVDTHDPKSRCEMLDFPFDAAWLRNKVAEMSGAIPTNLGGHRVFVGERASLEGRRKGREWVMQEYRRLGYEPELHYYGEGVNVVATKAGHSDRFLIVSAHYDTVPGSPGADDDASGITSNLAVASVLAKCDLGVGVRFVAFDQEEVGLKGSKAYAKKIVEDGDAGKLVGVVQVEMTAYDSDGDGSFNIIDCDDPSNGPLVNALSDAVRDNEMKLNVIRACTERSDHSSFWQIGRPAIAMSELFFGHHTDPTPCYHQSCDTVDHLNFDYMHRLTRALTYAVISLSQAQ